MIFSAKYRKSDGTLDFLEVEAESRSAVFQILKGRGINAIRVDEGPAKVAVRSRPKASHASVEGRGKSSSVIKGVFAGLLVVALALGACYWFFFSPSTVKPENPKAPANVSNTESDSPKQDAPAPGVKVPRAKPKTAEEVLASLENPVKPEIKKRELTPEEWNRLTNRVFHTGTEQLMSWIFTTDIGDMPMPIPPISKEDRENIVAMLISKNEINENDSDRVKDCKEQVELAKKEMIKYLKEGGDPDDFLQYYYQELKSSFEIRQEAIRLAEELYEEDPEAGAEYVDKVNAKLADQGIKLIRKEQFEE
jgi:hypothetical protein